MNRTAIYYYSHITTSIATQLLKSRNALSGRLSTKRL